VPPKRNHWKALHAYALSLPGAYEEHPWGRSVAKVNKKVFAFLGRPDEETPATIALKLRAAHDFALSLPGASETGYGLGRAGWVSVPVASGAVPLAVLREWIDESYALVAPKRRAATSANRRPSPKSRKAR
jgi:predicted DNA-binding protein (MmcQ/YjbR family)